MLGSTIGQFGHPFCIAVAALLAAFYALIPNYAIAIALVTLTVMALLWPLTLRAARAAMKTQLLAPELKRLREKYAPGPGMDAEERRSRHARQQEELLALYQARGIKPTAGFLPALLPLPIFLVLYSTIRGLIHQGWSSTAGALVAAPLYVSHATGLYRSLQDAGGAMRSFGINLADSVRSSGLSWDARLPLLGLVLIAAALQHLQMRQLNRRKSAIATRAQPHWLQWLLPVVLAVVYLSVPAGVNVYFVVAGVLRLLQQEVIHRLEREPRAAGS
jgi:YidC/Oxa1 family membrane protein insertase